MTAERRSGYFAIASSIVRFSSSGTWVSARSGMIAGSFSRSTASSQPRATSGCVMFGGRSWRSARVCGGSLNSGGTGAPVVSTSVSSAAVVPSAPGSLSGSVSARG